MKYFEVLGLAFPKKVVFGTKFWKIKNHATLIWINIKRLPKPNIPACGVTNSNRAFQQ